MEGILEVEQMLLQEVGNLGGRLEPLVGGLRQEFADDVRQPGGDGRVDVADWRRCVVTDSLQDGEGLAGLEGRRAGTQGAEDAAQAKQVAALIEGFAGACSGDM